MISFGSSARSTPVNASTRPAATPTRKTFFTLHLLRYVRNAKRKTGNLLHYLTNPRGQRQRYLPRTYQFFMKDSGLCGRPIGHDQDGDAETMQQGRDGLTKRQIGDEAMAVRAEDEQIELFRAGDAAEFLGRVAVAKDAARLPTVAAQVVDQLAQSP